VCESMHEGGADELAGPDGERRNDGGGKARRGLQPTRAPCGCFCGGGQRSGRCVAGGEQAGSKDISGTGRAKLIGSQESAQETSKPSEDIASPIQVPDAGATSEESQAHEESIPLVETTPKSHMEGPAMEEAAEVCTTSIHVTSQLLTVDVGRD
jgi:hypothetical protein